MLFPGSPDAGSDVRVPIGAVVFQVKKNSPVADALPSQTEVLESCSQLAVLTPGSHLEVETVDLEQMAPPGRGVVTVP
jgi:hypothetical protein